MRRMSAGAQGDAACSSAPFASELDVRRSAVWVTRSTGWIMAGQEMVELAGASEAAELMQAPENQIELSIVLPCLNEAETLGVCVEKAMGALQRHGSSAR
jgi:hypothetical protein